MIMDLETAQTHTSITKMDGTTLAQIHGLTTGKQDIDHGKDGALLIQTESIATMKEPATTDMILGGNPVNPITLQAPEQTETPGDQLAGATMMTLALPTIVRIRMEQPAPTISGEMKRITATIPLTAGVIMMENTAVAIVRDGMMTMAHTTTNVKTMANSAEITMTEETMTATDW